MNIQKKAIKLEFRSTFFNGKPSNFREKIETKIKKHTIRKVSNPVQEKDELEFYMDNGIFFCYAQCVSKQKIQIYNLFSDKHLLIDERVLNKKEIEILAINSGFDSVDDFWEYFKQEDLQGVLIHWTDLKY